MSFGFVGSAYNRASGTRDAFTGLSADLEREGHPSMVSLSGDREPADQLHIWHERMTLTPNGRKVYGTRVWQGRTWYQVHPDTVAPPETSNHEKRRSNDLKWPYNDQSTAAHKRARILATRHNITCEGLSFREPWHWTSWGPLGVIGVPNVAGAGSGSAKPVLPKPESEEDDMKILLMHVKLSNGTDPWYAVDYAAGTAARMHEGIQLDIARKYGQIVEVAGVQPESAIRGLRIVNG